MGHTNNRSMLMFIGIGLVAGVLASLGVGRGGWIAYLVGGR